MSLAPVCILAGGRATRLGAHASDRPKALVEVAGRPFVFHQLEQIRRHGGEEVVLCIGHLGEMLEEAVGDGAQAGLRVRYAWDPPGLAGTAGAVRGALDLLGERFLVLYGDTYLPVDFAAVDAAHRASGLPALMTVLENADRWGPSNAVYADRRVVRHDKRDPDGAMRWIDFGLGVLTREAFASTDACHEDLSDVYAQLARAGRLAGFPVAERFHEIGTPQALAETDAWLARMR
jgi:NDP-sugar pyrophosphorylase family protein